MYIQCMLYDITFIMNLIEKNPVDQKLQPGK